MEIIERVKTEVEQLRNTKGITFNEMVCYTNVLRLIDREISHKPLEGGQWGNLMRETKDKINLGRRYINEW